MARDRKKLIHIHSVLPDKQPTPETIELGELAINNSKGNEFISTKNTDNKVVRFSTDETLVTWMEKKTVMPYSGTVENVHLDTNRSNIELKFNQVASKNTPKYDKVNGGKDIDNNPINPSSDGGLTNGGGIAIDMSLYAMNGANPNFNSLDVACTTTLSGTTNIVGSTETDNRGASGIGNCSSKLNINVSTANTTVTTANTTITTSTTTIGTLNETVSGDTSERHSGATTIEYKGNTTFTEIGNLTENIKGNSTSIISGDVSTTISGTTTINTEDGTTIKTTKGDTNINTTGTTNITSTNSANINVIGNTCVTSTSDADFYGGTNTKVGIDCNGGITTHLIEKGADVIIESTETTATIKAKTTLDIDAADIDIDASSTVCVDGVATASLKGGTNTYVGIDCSGSNPTTTLTEKGSTVNISGNTTSITGATTLNLSGATTNISATTLGMNATALTEKGATVNISGNTTSITGATTLNLSGATTNISGGTINIIGTTYMQGLPFNGTKTIEASDGYNQVTADSGVTSETIQEALKEIRKRSLVTVQTRNQDNINDNSILKQYKIVQDGREYVIDIPKDFLVKSGSVVVNDSGDKVIRLVLNTKTGSESGNESTIDINVKDLVVDHKYINSDSVTIYTGYTNSIMDVSATTTINVNGVDGTQVGGGNNVVISGTNITIGTDGNGFSATDSIPNAINNAVDALNSSVNAATANDTVKASVTQSNGKLTKMTLEYNPKSLSWSYGSVTSASNGSYNDNTTASLTIPKTISDITNGIVNLTDNCLEINKNVCISGKVTANSGFYNTSDRRLKENITDVSYEDTVNAFKTPIVEFNYKEDPNRKVYGVIAQEVEANGLGELVYTDDKEMKSVDYTSLMILKIKYLENEVSTLKFINSTIFQKLSDLEAKIN